MTTSSNHHQSSKPKHKRTPTKQKNQSAHPWMKHLLVGLTCVSLGAAMFLPFQDGMLGWVAIFTLLGWHWENVGFWLYPAVTLYAIRVLFSLMGNEPRLPILKSLFLLILMIIAVASLRGSDFHTNIGMGVFFWLMSGYLLLMASICARYPKSYHNIKWLSSGVMLVLVCTIWANYAHNHRTLASVWHTKDAVLLEDNSESWQGEALGAIVPPQVGAQSASGVATVIKPLLNIALDPKTLIGVERVHDVYNPWKQHDAIVSCETAIKRNYPILLPPRFLEEGYEWRNYQHGDNICNNLIYVGTPNTNKNFDFKYKISQDPRSNIYLIFSNKKEQPVFNETFAMSRDFNGLKENSTYIQKLNSVFSRMVDDNAMPLLDNEYTFTKAEVPTQVDILGRGCEMKALHRPNLYQWGTGRVDFRGQSIAKVDTFCSKTHVAMTHLSHDDTKSGDTWENKLHIKIFRGKDLKPLECGAISIALNEDETRQFFSDNLKVEQLQINPDAEKGCLGASVLLSTGKTLVSH